MDFKKIAEHFRHSATPLVVTDIVIISDLGDFAGHGKIFREGGQIALDVTLQGDYELVTPTGIYKREQYWKIGGIIEGQTPFWGRGPPAQTRPSNRSFYPSAADVSISTASTIYCSRLKREISARLC